MSICDADTNELVNNIYEVLGIYEILKEGALLSEIDCREIFWQLGQEVSSAGSSGVLESIVLHWNEPDKSQKVSDDHIWSHDIEHAILSLEVVHKNTNE